MTSCVTHWIITFSETLATVINSCKGLQNIKQVLEYLWVDEPAQANSFLSIPTPCAYLDFEVETRTGINGFARESEIVRGSIMDERVLVAHRSGARGFFSPGLWCSCSVGKIVLCQ